eukprot:TRINITY_DN12440_c0_g1_i1.p1 TRINITY_DN12440_c0_g1~~TRINITY_DN12440_c0_g1_i1.p1  ORF type:complete len:314 (+),score=78.82 TRINITY_DN12440_c0_g1_i1:32-973(+)
MEEVNASHLFGRLRELSTSFQSLVDDVNLKIQLINEKDQRHEEMQKKVEENLAKVDEQIDLNVGGKRVSTSKSTLSSIQGTFFHAMLSSDKWKTNHEGEYFIDRNPTHFNRIVAYLRSGEMNVDGLTKSELDELSKELEYYQIPMPSQPDQSSTTSSQWQWDSSNTGSGIILSHEHKRASRTNSNGHSAVIGDASVTTFQLRFINRGTNGWAMVGLAPQTLKINSYDYNNCGWYLFLRDGTLYSQSGDNGRQYTSAIKNNSIIQVNHNKEKGTISFSIDEQDQGIAYHNIPSDMVLYPCVGLYQANSSIEIVD